jgi:hypothetical protein
MTLLLFDGLQDANTMQKPEWDILRAFTSTTGRDGSTNGAGQHVGSTSARQIKTLTFPSAAATCIIGFAFQMGSNALAAASSGNTWPLGLTVGGAVQLVLVPTSTGFLELRLGSSTGTLLASTTSANHTAIPTGEWHHLQVKAVIHTSSGSCVVKLDGVTVINYSGQTGTSSGSVDGYQIAARDQTANGNWYIIDDLWVCDAVDATSTQGRANNDFLGDLKVQSLIPAANGDTTQWTPSTGTNHALLVDEIPPNTTDYVFDSTSGHRDLFTLGDLPSAAITALGVRVGAYALKTDAGAASVKTLIKENSVVTADSAHPLTVSYAGYFSGFYWKRPSDSSLWTVSDVNGMQAGVENGT